VRFCRTGEQRALRHRQKERFPDPPKDEGCPLNSQAFGGLE